MKYDESSGQFLGLLRIRAVPKFVLCGSEISLFQAEYRVESTSFNTEAAYLHHLKLLNNSVRDFCKSI